MFSIYIFFIDIIEQFRNRINQIYKKAKRTINLIQQGYLLIERFKYLDKLQKEEYNKKKKGKIRVELSQSNQKKKLIKVSERFKMMTKILREKPLIDDNIRKLRNRNSKSEDFVFKSYKYEMNQFINGQNESMPFGNADIWSQEKKQNELQKYKRELEEKGNHFDIADFEQHEEDNNDDENIDDKFDIKPMQLIDFGQEDEDDDQQMHDVREEPTFNDEKYPNNKIDYDFIAQNNDEQTINTHHLPSFESIDNDQQCSSQNHQQPNTNKTQHKKSTNQTVQNNTIDQLKGIQITKLTNNANIDVQILDKQLFVTSKIPPGIVLKCKLKRSSGFMSMMSPEYDLYLENGLKHLVSAKKNVFKSKELFYLSTKMSTFDKPIRTLMSNNPHSTFWLVDKPRLIDRKMISYLDILIDYKPLVSNNKYSREMTVLCPPSLKTYHIGLEYDIPCIDFYRFQKNITLQLHYRSRNKLKQNSGKVSEKNFDLIDSQNEDQQKNVQVVKRKALYVQRNKHCPHQRQPTYFYLKMQKFSQNIFDIEIQHPLTPLQAMAIVLTRFDAQLK